MVTILGNSPNEILVACVADGAGSAKYSEEGASIACEAVLQGANKHYETDHRFDRLGVDDLLHWCETARQRFGELAEQRACPLRQFATTLCVAILSPRHALFFQIGDGAIILGSQGAYGVVFWPQSGEYANSTNFLTADKFRDLLEFRKVNRPFSEVALLTDGLERVALQFHSLIPRISDARELHELYGTTNRRLHFPEAQWHHLSSKRRFATSLWKKISGPPLDNG